MRVLWRCDDSMMTSPPRPPSPPEGPPRGTNFSRRKAMQPLPPSPALTRIFASSMNIRGFGARRERGQRGDGAHTACSGVKLPSSQFTNSGLKCLQLLLGVTGAIENGRLGEPLVAAPWPVCPEKAEIAPYSKAAGKSSLDEGEPWAWPGAAGEQRGMAGEARALHGCRR